MIKSEFYDRRIEARHVDFTLQATLVAIGDHILQVAGEDADRNGWGVNDLKRHNASWVLSRFAVEMKRRPQQYETIRIETWVSEVGRMTTTRNFRIWDAAGELIGASVSNWAVIDLSTRTLLDLQKVIESDYCAQEEPLPIDRPGKIVRVTPTRTTEYRVVYSDIDFNRHVNSMKYLQWMVDMLPEAWHIERHCSRYTLNFLHEAHYGDLLQICFEEAPVSLFEVRTEEGIPVCRAALEWQLPCYGKLK